jgi:hypothetical protein
MVGASIFRLMNGNVSGRVFFARAALQCEGAPLSRGVNEALARAKFETGKFKGDAERLESSEAEITYGRRLEPG